MTSSPGPVAGRLFETEHVPTLVNNAIAAAHGSAGGARRAASTSHVAPRGNLGRGGRAASRVTPPPSSTINAGSSFESREQRIRDRANQYTAAYQREEIAAEMRRRREQAERAEIERNRARLYGPARAENRRSYAERLARAEQNRVESELRTQHAQQVSRNMYSQLAAPPPPPFRARSSSTRPNTTGAPPAAAAAMSAGVSLSIALADDGFTFGTITGHHHHQQQQQQQQDDAQYRRAVQQSMDEAANGGINEAARAGSNLPCPRSNRPRRLPSSESRNIPDGEQCTVCLCELDHQNSKDIVVTFCGHCFHEACAEEAFNRSPLCPNCRHDQRDPNPRFASPLRRNRGGASFSSPTAATSSNGISAAALLRRDSFRVSREVSESLFRSSTIGNADNSDPVAASLHSFTVNNPNRPVPPTPPLAVPRVTASAAAVSQSPANNNNNNNNNNNDVDDDDEASLEPPTPARTCEKSLGEILRWCGLKSRFDKKPKESKDEDDDDDAEAEDNTPESVLAENPDDKAARHALAHREALQFDADLRAKRAARLRAKDGFDDCRTRAEVGFVKVVSRTDLPANHRERYAPKLPPMVGGATVMKVGGSAGRPADLEQAPARVNFTSVINLVPIYEEGRQPVS